MRSSPRSAGGLVLTVVLTVATAAASPVVSAFLALVFVAWAWVERGRERRRFALLAAAALAPVLAVAVLYPQGGSFPFRWEALVGTLAVSAPRRRAGPAAAPPRADRPP